METPTGPVLPLTHEEYQLMESAMLRVISSMDKLECFDVKVPAGKSEDGFFVVRTQNLGLPTLNSELYEKRVTIIQQREDKKAEPVLTIKYIPAYPRRPNDRDEPNETVPLHFEVTVLGQTLIKTEGTSISLMPMMDNFDLEKVVDLIEKAALRQQRNKEENVRSMQKGNATAVRAVIEGLSKCLSIS